MKVDFVPLDPSCAEELSERILRFWLEMYCGEVESGADGIRHIHSMEESPAHILRYMDEGTVYENVLLDGDLVGLLAYCVNDDDLYLDKLYIESGYRRIGLGTVCIERILEVAREKGCVSVSLVASKGNRPAYAFYGSLGFIRAGFMIIEDGRGHTGRRERLRKFL